MKKIEHRALLCLVLAAALTFGLAVFVVRFVSKGDRWVSFSGNRHLYNSQGQLAVGRVLDRDGDVLSWAEEDGTRKWYNNESVRKATLHAVGDSNGYIGTSALVAFADELSGYNLVTGADADAGKGNDLYLTLDARYNYTAYKALNGKKGAVGVYNYKTGDLLCMVSAPAFDPVHPPKIEEGDEKYDGVYLNRFLSGTFVPGSVFKTVTLAAAIDEIPDLFERRWVCNGSVNVGDGPITCPHAHGELDIAGALATSCNGVFAQLAQELGAGTLKRYAEKSGLTSSYTVDGIHTAAGRIRLTDATENQLGWAGVGQGDDLVNPCGLMVYMGAVANGGKTAVPRLILKTDRPGMPALPRGKADTTGRLVETDTAAILADMMAHNVEVTYGTRRFPNMDICAKSGTAEVGGGEAPTAWFTGFLRNPDHPYAFVVMVEGGGSGADTAGNVAAKVLDAIVNGY